MKSVAVIGLQKYLSQTAEIHGGYKYKDFVKNVDAGMSVKALAVMFNVTRSTIYKWLSVYEIERLKITRKG